MFSETPFNQNISGWNTAAVTDMWGMFEGANSFNQNIGSWNTAAVTSMRVMFQNATAFNQNLTGWCVSELYDSNEPDDFATSSALTDANKPVWGTCP
jgi:surface protein